MKEYCERCHSPLQEWEWCGRGLCEACEDEISNRQPDDLSGAAVAVLAFLLCLMPTATVVSIIYVAGYSGKPTALAGIGSGINPNRINQ